MLLLRSKMSSGRPEVPKEASQALNALILLPPGHLLTTLSAGSPARKRLSSITPCWNISNKRLEIFASFTSLLNHKHLEQCLTSPQLFVE